MIADSSTASGIEVHMKEAVLSLFSILIRRRAAPVIDSGGSKYAATTCRPCGSAFASAGGGVISYAVLRALSDFRRTPPVTLALSV